MPIGAAWVNDEPSARVVSAELRLIQRDRENYLVDAALLGQRRRGPDQHAPDAPAPSRPLRHRQLGQLHHRSGTRSVRRNHDHGPDGDIGTIAGHQRHRPFGKERFDIGNREPLAARSGVNGAPPGTERQLGKNRRVHTGTNDDVGRSHPSSIRCRTGTDRAAARHDALRPRRRDGCQRAIP